MFEPLKLKLNSQKISFKEKDSVLSVFSNKTDGFEVWIQKEGNEFIIGFDGWHESFSDETHAINCFMSGLSADVRLKVEYYGKTPLKWTLEYNENGNWIVDSEVGNIIKPFWKKPEIRYLSNI